MIKVCRFRVSQMSPCSFCSEHSTDSRLWCLSDWKFTEVGSSWPLDLVMEANQSDQTLYGWGSVVRASTSVASSARNMSGWWLHDCCILKFQCNHVALFPHKNVFFKNPPSLLETRDGRKHGRSRSRLRLFSALRFSFVACMEYCPQ